jgi:hypothetical protein
LNTPSVTPPKNPAAAPRKRNITYQVKWDSERRRFLALDDSLALIGLSPAKGLAIGIAKTAAIDAARTRRAKVTLMVEDYDGKLRKHWTFAPLGKGHA